MCPIFFLFIQVVLPSLSLEEGATQRWEQLLGAGPRHLVAPPKLFATTISFSTRIDRHHHKRNFIALDNTTYDRHKNSLLFVLLFDIIKIYCCRYGQMNVMFDHIFMGDIMVARFSNLV